MLERHAFDPPNSLKPVIALEEMRLDDQILSVDPCYASILARPEVVLAIHKIAAPAA